MSERQLCLLAIRVRLLCGVRGGNAAAKSICMVESVAVKLASKWREGIFGPVC